VYDYPKEIKPFYMRLNDDGKTVTAMDVLVPGIGEIVGGSQREERLDILLDNMKRLGLSEEAYWWYIDLRRFGSVPHAGFGAGFERLLMFLTGVGNIRDVLPYARTPRNCEF
jgi:asparaginyl-tRNA synthetase